MGAALKSADYWTTGKVARLCGCAPRTVQKWCNSGRLPAFRLPQSLDRRICTEDLLKFLRESGYTREAAAVLGERPVLVVGAPTDLAFAVQGWLRANNLLWAGRLVERHLPGVVVLDVRELGAEGMVAAVHLLAMELAPRVVLLWPEDKPVRLLDELKGEQWCSVLQHPVSVVALVDKVEGLR